MTPTTRVLTPLSAYQTQAKGAIAPVVAAYAVWGVLAVLVFLLLAFAVALALREEETVERCRGLVGRRPATVIGAALVVAGVGFLAATVVLYLKGIEGIRIPVGSLFALLLGGLLLSNDP